MWCQGHVVDNLSMGEFYFGTSRVWSTREGLNDVQVCVQVRCLAGARQPSGFCTLEVGDIHASKMPS